MNKPKVLSGDELVARGALKRDVSLPEIGLKDVLPNGSWLEQKQIQSALEARKHLIEVERIDKCGILSHANWREDLKLAEVTQQIGGHWQFLGHNVGRQLYLYPEEALYLMEVNCLLLKYNGVTVSLQQAYSLLLRSNITLLHYKVYASLSRLGYKLIRFDENTHTSVGQKPNDSQENGKEENGEIQAQSNINREKQDTVENVKMEVDSVGVSEIPGGDLNSKSENNALTGNDTEEPAQSNSNGGKQETVKNAEMEADSVGVSKTPGCDSNSKSENNALTENDTEEPAQSNSNGGKQETVQNTKIEVDSVGVSEIPGGDLNSKSESNPIIENDTEKPGCSNVEMCIDIDAIPNKECTNKNVMQNAKNRKDLLSEASVAPIYKLQLLRKRTIKPFNTKHTEKCFEQVPDFTDKQIVTLTVPKEEHIPRNVFLNNVTYVLNLEAIRNKTKAVRPDSVEPRPYSASEEVNGDHVRRIKGSNNSRYNGSPFSAGKFRPNLQFRSNVWRPNNMNFFPFNVFFQRTFMNFQMPRFNSFFPRPPLLGMYPRFPNFPQNVQETNVTENIRKRKNDQRLNNKQEHLQAIKNLATRIKQLVQSGYIQTRNVDALQKLIRTFNQSYNMRLKFTNDYEVVNDENIVETIFLDEDGTPSKKKAKSEEDYNYTENLDRLKRMALKLMGLDSKGEISSRHRRAFSNLIKKFNKSYNAEIYLNDNFEIKDRKLISLDSSSDSDCVVEVTPKKTKGKKLKNPFSVLKRLQEKNIATSSVTSEGLIETKDGKYNKELKEKLGNNWLPGEEDFGTAEVLPKTMTNTYLIHAKREEHLFEFIKSQSFEFDNWMDIKIAFLRNLEETYRMNLIPVTFNEEGESSLLKSLIGPDDCGDTHSVLKKLSIISTEKEYDDKSSLAINFNVYNRDVLNFKKTNLPKPHFRVICISESSNLPTGKDVVSLYSKLDDNIPIFFAIVGVGSVSYLQIKSVDLPVYIPSNDLD